MLLLACTPDTPRCLVENVQDEEGSCISLGSDGRRHTERPARLLRSADGPRRPAPLAAARPSNG